MADTVVNALAPVADWYLNQIIEHGPLTVLALTAMAFVALWCTAGIALFVYEQHLDRRSKGVAE
jgi:hypothetical protein